MQVQSHNVGRVKGQVLINPFTKLRAKLEANARQAQLPLPCSKM